MSVGLLIIWNPSRDELVASRSWREADEWLAWMSRDLTNLRTRLDEGGRRIGTRQLRADGYDADSKVVDYEFHGFWQGHQCWLTAKTFAGAEADPFSPSPSSS